MDAAQARAEPVVADHHDRRPAALGQLAEPADRLVEPADDLGRRRVPVRVVDAGLVDVQVGPDAVLERVEVLELDHQDRPVGDDPVGEQPPSARPRKLSAVSRALLGQLVERLRGSLPEVAQAVAGRLGLEPGGELGAAERAASRCGASMPETTIPRTLSGG